MLFLGSVFYQVAQLSIAIVLPQVGRSLHATTGQLGLILAGFPLGVGVFAILAGFSVHRWGTARTIIGGSFLTAGATILSAFATSPFEMLAIRAVAGAGVGLYFPPIVAVLAANTPEARRAIFVGLLVSLGLGIGGCIEFLGGGIAVTQYGWRAVLGGTGLLDVGWAVLNSLVLRRYPLSLAPGEPALSRTLIGQTLRMRSTWAISFALLGALNAGFTIIAFLAAYLSGQHSSWGPLYVGAVGATALIMTVPGGFLGGWASERGVDRRVVIGIFGVGSATLFLGIPVAGKLEFAVILTLLGLLLGAVLAILFSMPAHIPEMSGGRLPVVVGFIDGTRILFSSAFAIGFGFFVGLEGYSTAWIATGIFALCCLPALRFVPANRSPPRPTPTSSPN